MLIKTSLSLISVGLLNYGTVSVSLAQTVPPTSAPTVPPTSAPTVQPSNVPPESVMKQFYGYLQQYTLWLGEDRGACSYNVDPTSVKKDGADRFFLAKISRGQGGTGCRGVLAFRIMQVNCKNNTLYEFVREQKDDIRFAGWERYKITLNDPTNSTFKDRSKEAVKVICTL